MNRRSFLNCLGFGTVAAAAAANGLIDIERLLWIRGEKTIFVPLPPTIAPLVTTLTRGDIFTITGVNALNPLTQQPTAILQRFVITADVSAGEILQAEHVWPMPRDRGIYQNVSESPVRHGRIDGSRIQPYLWGQSVPPPEAGTGA